MNKPQGKPDMEPTIPRVSWWESLLFNVLHVIPYALQGIYLHSRRMTGFFTRHHPDYLMLKFGQRLRRRYQAPAVQIRFLLKRSVLVLDHSLTPHILNNSPNIYAEPSTKKRGMSHFQPDALTISRGNEWQQRRRFNQAIVGCPMHGNDSQKQGLHPDAAAFATAVNVAVIEFHVSKKPLNYDALDAIVERITLAVVFGAGCRESSITEQLRRLMREANRFQTKRDTKRYKAFDRRIRETLKYAEPDSLMARAAADEAAGEHWAATQVPHWLFAMRDTLTENTARALALILSNGKAEETVRAEIKDVNLSNAEDLATAELRYTSACLQEAMRLWPTTPFLVRTTLREDVLAGTVIGRNTQVIIPNNFLHRDELQTAKANRFQPELWLESDTDFRFNHLSNGRQSCAGKGLVLFLGTAVLAGLLQGQRYRLETPQFPLSGLLPQGVNAFSLYAERI